MMSCDAMECCRGGLHLLKWFGINLRYQLIESVIMIRHALNDICRYVIFQIEAH